MLRILHLSDLHLGPAGAWPVGDYTKTEIVSDRHRLTRHDLLRGTLDALGVRLAQRGDTLDAVVVSGDVTVQASDEGLASLPALLDHLGDSYPGAARTLVVPGNHDVAWRELPDSAQRYAGFIKHLRGAGYVTPLLEGIDISSDDGASTGTTHDPILELGDAVLIAMNSSNYCGTLESLGKVTEGDLDGLKLLAATDSRLDRLLERFDQLRLVDLCKVSKGQTEALASRLAEFGPNADFRLKIAVLHHQLLPVNLEEEVKPYETMVNLGFVRAWLAHQGIHLVLHGHKHAPQTYLDIPTASPLLTPGHRVKDGFMMVSSVATANNEAPSEIARLVEITSQGDRTRSVSVLAIPPNYPKLGSSASPVEVGRALVQRESVVPAIGVFEGETVNDVFQQLLAAFPSESYDTVSDVICRVANGSTCSQLPSGYPVPEGEVPEEWFSETVDWWQNPEPQLSSTQFNHGERIWRYASSVDQFTAAVSELAKRPATSRSIMVLLDPRSNQESFARYPALSMVQLRIPVGTGRLDCIGFFRKQQMRAWWPINVGELARIQQRAVERLSGVAPGAIVTVSALALGGSDRPRVAVPRLDRWSQDKPGALWELALATLNPVHTAHDAVVAEWSRLFTDWRPGTAMERDGVPVALRGLDTLADAVETCAKSFPNSFAGFLVAQLRDLSRINQAYWNNDSDGLADDERREAFRLWAPTALLAIDRVMDHARAVAEVSSEAEPEVLS